MRVITDSRSILKAIADVSARFKSWVVHYYGNGRFIFKRIV